MGTGGGFKVGRGVTHDSNNVGQGCNEEGRARRKVGKGRSDAPPSPTRTNGVLNLVPHLDQTSNLCSLPRPARPVRTEETGGGFQGVQSPNLPHGYSNDRPYTSGHTNQNKNRGQLLQHREYSSQQQHHKISNVQHTALGIPLPKNHPGQPSIRPTTASSTSAGRGASNPSRRVRERMKHPRLNGADLYVTRIGSDNPHLKTQCATSKKKSKSKSTSADTAPSDVPASDDTTALSPPPSSPTASLRTASLHDELINPFPSPKTSGASSETTSSKDSSDDASALPRICDSRPCYRCVAYMHSVGIKRVFWTTASGQWEGGKVAELIGSLDGSSCKSPGSGFDSDGGREIGRAGKGASGKVRYGDHDEAAATATPLQTPSLFITKYEVLMLRRVMSEKQQAAAAAAGAANKNLRHRRSKSGGKTRH